MQPDGEQWCQALKSAGLERDWERLARLDGRLSALLQSRQWQPAAAERAALAEVYREVMMISQAETELLQCKLAALDNQREAQLSYAQVSDWESA